MSIVTDDLVNLIQPPYVNPFYGTHTCRVVPRIDLEEADLDRYWRYFKKFPNEFASAVSKLLPTCCTLVSYDHLNNVLTYEQRTRSSNL